VRWGQVIAFYGVFGLLAAEYWMFERPEPPRREIEQSRPRFLAMDAGTVRELRLQREGRRVVSRRGTTGWGVVEPPGATIPPDLIAAFANALTGAEEIARVGDPGDQAPAYGFDERAARVEMIAESGDRVVVTIGETNPTGTAVYARRAGAPDVVLIGRQVRYYEDLIFQALSAGHVPEAEQNAPVGG